MKGSEMGCITDAGFQYGGTIATPLLRRKNLGGCPMGSSNKY